MKKYLKSSAIMQSQFDIEAVVLKRAIEEGVKSGIAINFDPEEHLVAIKNLHFQIAHKQ
ncbi:hypothetical protein [Alistipes putredinis]|uniref:hypothetical protein n=1 Tax=Alistipes putredinis TaxID=28117 RepID=UPI003AB7D0AD